ncbi:radical SAM protein [Nesterenkonia sp. HG001]|uniref:radical SAM protein n=1 Tax=Nesterenkonia sp. HG001 TaxID=2983207 RepID=UPI002AC70CD7|nr:radical SAM protein [Nesterenkonia sp. HG001]MDZ5079173.1 radical SAM protein [Nesterenkonia sp. HG001]
MVTPSYPTNLAAGIPARRTGSPALPIPPPNSHLERIRRLLDKHGQPDYQFTALLQGLRAGRTARFGDAHHLPRLVRDDLEARLGPIILPATVVSSSEDASVEKVLFSGDKPGYFEAVRSRFRDGWSSICLSSQSGCGLACTFCATGAVGLVRNLDAEEILAQALYAPWQRDRAFPVKSIAFMGMGEPLANPRIFTALDMLTDPQVGGWSPRRITVSTVGFAPRLAQLVAQHPHVTITLSVHSPFPDQRSILIPLQKRFPLEASVDILDRHVAATRRRVFLAYLLIDGVNDSAEHAEHLARLVKHRSRPDLFKVSVIAYNEAAGVTAPYRRPATRTVQEFVACLRSAGVAVSRRQQFGAGIDAACGQLHADYLNARDAPHTPPTPRQAATGGDTP